MGHVRRFDHIGVTVADLEAATAFFVGLGLEVGGTTTVEGECVEIVCGLPGARCQIVMLRPPGGGSKPEVASFVTPENLPGSPNAMANEVDLRTVSFEVGDLDAALAAVAVEGYGLVAGVGDHEGLVRMAYVRGLKGSWCRCSSRPVDCCCCAVAVVRLAHHDHRTSRRPPTHDDAARGARRLARERDPRHVRRAPPR